MGDSVTKVEVCIVGAGPAGLACALQLLERGISVLILEIGSKKTRRQCQMERNGRCDGCNDMCETLTGLGGCIDPQEGIKLSFYPCSRKLSRLIGTSKMQKYSLSILKKIERVTKKTLHMDSDKIPAFVEEAFCNNGLRIRPYPVTIMDKHGTTSYLSYCREQLHDVVKFESPVTSISKKDDRWSLKVSGMNGGHIIANSIVVATGRVGGARRNLMDLNLKYEEQNIHLGLRFILPNKYLTILNNFSSDLKIENTKERIKTFCLCAGKGGGKVKFMRYNGFSGHNIISIDGCVDTSEHHENCFGNFALLLEFDDINYAYRDKFIGKYLKLSSGIPIKQTYIDFKNKVDNCKCKINEPDYVDNIKWGKLFSLFESNHHHMLCENFSKILSSINRLSGNNFDINQIERETIVLGPEVEFFWDKISLTKDCETSIQNCYVAGDMAGYSQGIISSMIMGELVADTISERIS